MIFIMYYITLYSYCIKLFYIYISIYMYNYIYITVYHIVSYHIILCYTVLNKYYIYYFTYLLFDFKRSPLFILDPLVRLLSNFEGSTILRQTHPAGFCFCAQTSWGSIDWRYLGQISSHGPVSLQKVGHSTSLADRSIIPEPRRISAPPMWLQSRHDDYAGFITDWMIQSLIQTLTKKLVSQTGIQIVWIHMNSYLVI